MIMGAQVNKNLVRKLKRLLDVKVQYVDSPGGRTGFLAFYDYIDDVVSVKRGLHPIIERSVLIHELIHASGHKTRLDRFNWDESKITRDQWVRISFKEEVLAHSVGRGLDIYSYNRTQDLLGRNKHLMLSIYKSKLDTNDFAWVGEQVSRVKRLLRLNKVI